MLRMSWHIIFTLFLTMSSIPESSSLTVSDKQITLTHHDYEKSWNEAQAICVAKGGSLFTEDSTERSNVIANFRGSWTKRDVWIGLHYPVAESADEYGWTDCFRQDLTANTHWMSSEPKMSSSQRCAISDKTGGDWRTAACDSSNRFVCQTEGGACTFTTGSGTPITPLNYEAVSTTAATIDSCKSRCLTTTHNFKNCWALNYAVTSVCVLYYTDDPFLFLPLGITTGSTAFHVKECYTSIIDITDNTTIRQAPAAEPQAGCTTFNDRTTPATTTTTTTAAPTTTTTTIVAQPPPTTTVVAPPPPTTTVVAPPPPTTTIVAPPPPTTTLAAPPPPTTTIVAPPPPTTTLAAPPPPTTTVVAPPPPTTTIVAPPPPTTTVVAPPPPTTTIVAPPPPTTTLAAPPPPTTTIVAQPPLTTTIVAPPPTTTNLAAPPPPTTTVVAPPPPTTTVVAPTSASTTTAAPTTISTNTHASVTTAASTTTSTTTQAAATTSTVSSSTSTTPVATSSTTTQASSTTSTSSTTLSTTTAQTQCFCPCSSGLSETANLTTIEKVALIQSKLKVDSKSLSSTVRKKTSAKDERKASQSVGYIAIAFSCVQLGFIVIPDLFKVVYYCFNWLKSSSAVTP